MNLTTNYLGLSLRSPLVPSASPLSEKIDNIRAMEQAGAAAVVCHSLFEEQIEATAPEFRIDPKTYLENIAQAKGAVGIPIIGSLNCTTLGGWISYARRITEAGADALELNIYRIPTRPDVTGSTIANTNMTTGDDGILMLDNGSAAMTVSVTGSTFTDNKGDHFQAASDASSTGSVNVTFDKACDNSAVLGRLETNPPAGLYGAPPERQKSVVKDPNTLRKLST